MGQEIIIIALALLGGAVKAIQPKQFKKMP